MKREKSIKEVDWRLTAHGSKWDKEMLFSVELEKVTQQGSL